MTPVSANGLLGASSSALHFGNPGGGLLGWVLVVLFVVLGVLGIREALRLPTAGKRAAAASLRVENASSPSRSISSSAASSIRSFDSGCRSRRPPDRATVTSFTPTYTVSLDGLTV